MIHHHIQIKSYESLKTVLLQLGDVEEQLNLQQKNWIMHQALRFMLAQRWQGSRFQSVSTELMRVLQINKSEVDQWVRDIQESEGITLQQFKPD